MGQPVTVVEKPTPMRGVVRFETNRALTGMGHERYRSLADCIGDRPPDVLARRLFERGGVDAVHIYSNVITVDVTKGYTTEGIADIIRDLYIHYVPGVLPPSDEELTGDAGGDEQPATT
jgi:hypothetical protein